MRIKINWMWEEALVRRSAKAIHALDEWFETLIRIWICGVLLIGLAKILHAPVRPSGIVPWFQSFLPYLLVCFSPVAGYRVASGSFPKRLLAGQPALRLAHIGQWRDLGVLGAHKHPAFGPVGLLASLTIGLLLNIPVRTLELMTAMPALNIEAPVWALTLNVAMTGDVIVMNFFYAACFVMALRSIPLFPRMLLFTWCMDIMMQFVIAHAVTGAPDLPGHIRTLLHRLLVGNIDKVLISVLIWLPYLLLSERVNVTFRWRTAQAR